MTRIPPVDVARRGNGALTVITPLKRRGPYWLGFRFRLTHWFPNLLGLQHFDSVFFSNWNIVTRLPDDGQQAVELPQPVLLWEVAYSAEVDPYIESFVRGIGKNIKRIWGTSYGFPGTRSVGKLRAYIEGLSWTIDHFHWAYPEESVRTVKSALAISREHAFLVEAARTCTPEDFERIYRGFLLRRGADL